MYTNSNLEDYITVEQTGFRTERSTCDQVLAQTTFIRNGFQQNFKIGAAFMDLSTAYNSFSHTGLFLIKGLTTLACLVNRPTS